MSVIKCCISIYCDYQVLYVIIEGVTVFVSVFVGQTSECDMVAVRVSQCLN